MHPAARRHPSTYEDTDAAGEPRTLHLADDADVSTRTREAIERLEMGVGKVMPVEELLAEERRDPLGRVELGLAPGVLARHRRALRFVWRNDDLYQVRYGPHTLMEVCYDDFGSTGMSGIQDVLEVFAEAVGVEHLTVGSRGR